MSIDQNNFFDKLNEIKELYIEVKEAIILAENFDPIAEVYLSPLNELRNSLDHIMRCLIYPDKVQAEFDEAKEHLYRAGYDAYEVLAINVATAIVKSVEKYDAEIISTIFPKYYTEIKPLLIGSKQELADARAHKRLNPETGTKSFTPYKEKTTLLIASYKNCTGQIPNLQKEKIKKRNKKWVNTIIGIIIGIAITVVGTWAYYKFIAPKGNQNKPNIQNTAS